MFCGDCSKYHVPVSNGNKARACRLCCFAKQSESPHAYYYLLSSTQRGKFIEFSKMIDLDWKEISSFPVKQFEVVSSKGVTFTKATGKLQ